MIERGDHIYGSRRLDHRLRITRGNDVDVTLWAAKIKYSTTRDLSLSDPLPTNAVDHMYVIRWRADIARANIESNFRAILQPAEDDDTGYRVARVQEVGRRKFLKLELSLI